MPGWYVHLDAARTALDAKTLSNARTSAIFQQAGPSAADLSKIALDPQNQAYVALGAIGPDLFFLLPDFKPGMGQLVYGVANTVRDLYVWLDDNFIAPWTNAMDPIIANVNSQLNQLTGGVLQQLETIMTDVSAFLRDFWVVLGTRNVDLFSVLGSGVIAGYDEKTFFWSDILHYRKTYEFARNLWTNAELVASGNLLGSDGKPIAPASDAPHFQAYALGWMTHLGTDVAGHAFVNEKCGGPFRLHWQRHHVVENHIDAKVYDSRYGTQNVYQMLGASMMHLWLAFEKDGAGRSGVEHPGEKIPVLFDDTQRPSYPTGDLAGDDLARHKIFDIDSDMPPTLAAFVVRTLHDTYDGNAAEDKQPTSAGAPHPTILAATEPAMHPDGFPTVDDVAGTYWWLYHYVKYISTDYWTIRRPLTPQFEVPQPPSPPYAGTDDPPIDSSAPFPVQAEELFLAILAYLLYGKELAEYLQHFLESLVASAATLPLREAIYEYLELPVYNMWMVLHWYLSMAGYVAPMQNDISEGQTRLGSSSDDDWKAVWAALQTGSGNVSMSTSGTEPSGHDVNHTYPRDVVEDTPTNLQSWLEHLPPPLPQFPHCSSATRAPSEFLRPWEFPLANNDGTTVPQELPAAVASPFASGTDATVLIGGAPGDNTARGAFERCENEGSTEKIAKAFLPQGKHLGDPVDYSTYVIAQLTRTTPETIANFNLDADRGYAYLCWDWKRSSVMAHPPSFSTASNDYPAPVSAGSGWCVDDLPASAHGVPKMHDQVPATTPVKIRYIGREDK